MNASQKGLIEIIGHEGLCLRPYLDSVGVWTLGVGHTASEDPDPKYMSKTDYITVAYAMELFKDDIQRYEQAVRVALKVPVSQEQFDALVSICYNIGMGGLKGSTFIKRINAGASVGQSPLAFADVLTGGIEELSLIGRTDSSIVYEEQEELGFSSGSVVDAILMWRKPQEILGRRRKEAKLFSTGVYSNGGKALQFDTNGAGRVSYRNGKTINIADML